MIKMEMILISIVSGFVGAVVCLLVIKFLKNGMLSLERELDSIEVTNSRIRDDNLIATVINTGDQKINSLSCKVLSNDDDGNLINEFTGFSMRDIEPNEPIEVVIAILDENGPIDTIPLNHKIVDIKARISKAIF